MSSSFGQKPLHICMSLFDIKETKPSLYLVLTLVDYSWVTFLNLPMIIDNVVGQLYVDCGITELRVLNYRIAFGKAIFKTFEKGL